MEQKKILWIVVIVSVFVLLIFGAALLLYAPSRSSGPTLQPAVITQTASKPGTAPADQTGSGIDPDSWVREPGKTPGLSSTPPTTPNNINLTIVNGDNAGSTYGTLDVSGLTQTPPPQDIPPATTLADSTNATQDQTAPQTTVKPTQPGTPAPAQTSVKPVKPSKAAPAKSAITPEPKKTTTVIVTEYWIQTGSFSSKVNAEKARETLTARYLNAEIFTKAVKSATTFRVRVGPYKTKDEASYWLGTIKDIPGFTGSFISEVKTKK